jgi:hypothetical protein
MVDWYGVAGLIGWLSICVFLIVMGLLSRRLGQVTYARSYYIGFFSGAALVSIGIVSRIINLTNELALIPNLHDNITWVLLYNGAPAAGVTVGLIVAWRYWSWLLAERE